MFSVGVLYDDKEIPAWQLLKADIEDITQEEARLWEQDEEADALIHEEDTLRN